jgi:hypothetical protein
VQGCRTPDQLLVPDLSEQLCSIKASIWTPEGFVGNLFRTMAPYAPPPPPFASPPPQWGNEEHVRELFGDRVTELQMRRQQIVMDRCSDPVEFREYYKRNYGPTIAVYRFNTADPERIAALDRDFLQLLTTWKSGGIYRPSICWSAPASDKSGDHLRAGPGGRSRLPWCRAAG